MNENHRKSDIDAALVARFVQSSVVVVVIVVVVVVIVVVIDLSERKSG